jgi:hypothetical protein
MAQERSYPPVIGLAAALVGTLIYGNVARAAELHFVAQSIGEKRAVWLPQVVVIHPNAEIREEMGAALPGARSTRFRSVGQR